MKRIISIFFVVLMLFSVAIIPSAAYSNLELYKQNNMYVESYHEQYGIIEQYTEKYYHQMDDTDPNSQIDWVLISAYSFMDAFSWDNTNYSVVGNRIIKCPDGFKPFGLTYCIYDVLEDEFTDIAKINIDDYSGLSECLDELEIGEPVGDADRDKKLTVLDATEIQRALAEIIEFHPSDTLRRADFICIGEQLNYVSDFNRDGKRTVMDATGIQMHLAQLHIPVDTPDQA
ncbi:MAG: hypothetical protein E7513_02955 [Ruminococcaceae bacterium]|nr:hypothetical protein [Oscillospiraceae bacterium]